MRQDDLDRSKTIDADGEPEEHKEPEEPPSENAPDWKWLVILYAIAMAGITLMVIFGDP